MKNLNFSHLFPIPYIENKLHIHYPDGATLIVILDDNAFYIIGKGDYWENIDILNEQVQKEIMEQYFQVAPARIIKQKENLFIDFIEPIPRTAVSLKNALPFSSNDFYLDKSKIINRIYKACSNHYSDCTPDSFYLVIYQPYIISTGVFFLGYTLDSEYDLSTLQKAFGNQVYTISFAKYFDERAKITSKILPSEPYESEANARESAEKKELMKTAILSFLESYSYPDFHSAIVSRVIGQPNLSLVLANIYNYLENIANGTPCHSNILLSAPSGCGKTETYRALHDYFAEKLPFLPVLLIDVTHFTEAGYRGRNSDEILQTIAARKTLGIGLVFFDEFDKKLIPSIGSTGINYNAAFQTELLTLLEGGPILDKNGKLLFNSSNTLFICLGSFNHVREKKIKKFNTKSIGFESQVQPSPSNHYMNITISDVIEQGASYELAGRFSLFINYYQLSPNAIDLIIDKTIAQISKGLSIDIRISSSMRVFLHQNANSEYGCRGLKSLLEQAVYPIFSQILLNEKYRSEFEIILNDEQNSYYKRKVLEPNEAF